MACIHSHSYCVLDALNKWGLRGTERHFLSSGRKPRLSLNLRIPCLSFPSSFYFISFLFFFVLSCPLVPRTTNVSAKEGVATPTDQTTDQISMRHEEFRFFMNITKPLVLCILHIPNLTSCKPFKHGPGKYRSPPAFSQVKSPSLYKTIRTCCITCNHHDSITALQRPQAASELIKEYTHKQLVSLLCQLSNRQNVNHFVITFSLKELRPGSYHSSSTGYCPVRQAVQCPVFSKHSRPLPFS